ncbi:MAG: ABC transporter ATP-binding protein [Kiritimatiellia bacterium]|jgi:oligopeptide/dipeptide ABC transporter ATP-binding protein
MNPSPSNAATAPILSVRDLRVTFASETGVVGAVNGVSFDLGRKRVLAVVGESGCGKSVTAYSILRLVRPPGRIAGGTIRYFPDDGRPALDLAALDEKDDRLFQVRGGDISMIFQEPMSALSPVHTVGNQICEAILLHQDATPAQARELAIDMLGKVGIAGPERRVDQYPHELSGGMRQRVVIAMALVCNPRILIADEPTTALDVTLQAQILKLIKDLQEARGASVIFITHDLGVVAQIADDVAVMYLGRVVEKGTVRQVLRTPRHPYTAALLQSLPGAQPRRGRLPAIAGSVPSLNAIPRGCPFHPRCPRALGGVCDVGDPPALHPLGAGQAAACRRLGDAPSPAAPTEGGSA